VPRILRVILIAISFLMVTYLYAVLTVKAATLEETIQDTAIHLVTVNSECSGTVVSPSVILTARHCMGVPVTSIEIGGPDRICKHFGKVIKAKNADLALITVLNCGALPVAPIAASAMHRGDKFELIGLSYDVGWALSQGFVMSSDLQDIRYHKDPATYHVIALACMGCDEGDSGAGVFNLQGELEGVFVASSENNVRTYMVPLAVVKAFLQGNHV